MTRTISAVALLVPDYQSGLDFYVGKLGFHLISDDDQGGGKRFVQVAPGNGGTALLLAKASGSVQEAAIGNQTGGRVGFFLTTDDFVRDHAKMIKAGVVFEEEPRHEPYGTVAVWRDPFGNRWDLIEFVG